MIKDTLYTIKDQLHEKWLIRFLLFAFASGSLAHLLPAVLPVTRYTTDPLLLLVNGLVIYMVYKRNRDNRLWWWLLLAYWLTFFTEVAGVATGAIFGEYAYGATMRWQWLNVPFVIALNWAVLTLAGNALADRVTTNPYFGAALTGIFLALYDIAIEPVAIALDYWSWAAVDVPVQNYLAWAIVAFLISLPLRLLKIRYQSPVLFVYFFAQLAFFLILNIGL